MTFDIDDTSFSFTVASHDAETFTVISFRGTERLSHLFAWRVVAAFADHGSPPELALGAEATFSVHSRGELVRFVRGIVSEVEPESRHEEGRHRQASFVLVPLLAELTYEVTSRIFQNKSVIDVVDDLVTPYGIETEWRLDRAPAPRGYRVQKNECTYDFVCRILAEAGIHFHFEHGPKRTVLVFVNAARGYDPLPGGEVLPFRKVVGAVVGDCVMHLTRGRALRPASTTLRDYDFIRPSQDLTAHASAPPPHDAEIAPRREVYLWPGDYNVAAPDGTTLATIRLQECSRARRSAEIWAARSAG